MTRRSVAALCPNARTTSSRLTEGPTRRNLPRMAVGSILLAVLALISMGIGVLTTPIPVVGAVLSFGAPALALLGIVLGGKAMSRAKQRGAVDGTAQAGVIVSALAMVPALL